MPILAPFYPIIIAFLICTNGIAGVMWIVKSKDATSYKSQLETCKARHQAFVDQVEAQGKIAEAKAKQVEAENRRIADETAKGWAAALDVVRADIDRRLRLAAARGSAASGSVPGPTGGTVRIDDPTESPLPPPERVVADCAEDVLKLAWLQDFVRRVAKTKYP